VFVLRAADELPNDAGSDQATGVTRFRDPVGPDVGERYKTVLISWTAWLDTVDLDNIELDDFTCLDRSALDHVQGPAMLAQALLRSIRRKAVQKLAGGVLGMPRHSNAQSPARIVVAASVDYHWPHPLMRRRGHLWRPREELQMHQAWHFTTAHPLSDAFGEASGALRGLIRAQGWPLNEEQRGRLAKVAVSANPEQLCFQFAEGHADAQPSRQRRSRRAS
jgi:hypothetical protein